MSDTVRTIMFLFIILYNYSSLNKEIKAFFNRLLFYILEYVVVVLHLFLFLKYHIYTGKFNSSSPNLVALGFFLNQKKSDFYSAWKSSFK